MSEGGRMPGVTRPSPWFRLAPWLLFAGALLLRLAYLWQAGHADPLFESLELVADSRYYDLSARAVAAGHLRPSGAYFLAPLYFYVMGAVYAVFGPGLVAVQGLQALLGAASCVLVQRIGRRVFSPPVGDLAGAALALYGLHVYYTGVILPTVLVVFVNLLFLWLVIDAEPRAGRGRLLAAGLVLGLATAAKPNAILMLPACALALFLAERGVGSAGDRALRGALLAAGTVLAILPFSAHNYAASGEFVLMTTTAGRNLLMGNGPNADGSHVFFPPGVGGTSLANYLEGDVPGPVAVAEDRQMRAAARRLMLERPARTAALFFKKFLLFFNATELSIRDQFYFAKRWSAILRLPLVSFGAAVPIALVALAVAWRRSRRSWVLYAALAAQVASYVPLFVLARYRMVAVTCLLPFAAFGVVSGVELVQRRRWRLLAGLSLACLLAAGFVHLRFAEFPRERGFADQWQGLGDHALAAGDAAGALASYREALSARWLRDDEEKERLAVRVQIARAYLAQGDRARAEAEAAAVRRALPGERTAWPPALSAALSVLERELARPAGPPGAGR